MSYIPPPPRPHSDDNEAHGKPARSPLVTDPPLFGKDELIPNTHMETPKPDEALRQLASARFDKNNGDARELVATRSTLEGRRARLIKSADDHDRQREGVTKYEVHRVKEGEFAQPLVIYFCLVVLVISALGMSVGSVWGASVWILNSELMESISSLTDALPLGLVSVATLVAIPLAQYANTASDQEKSRLFDRLSKGGHVLGIRWFYAYVFASFADRALSSSAGHVPHGTAMQTVASILPFLHAACLSLILPLQVCGEAAASVCFWIWAIRISQRGHKRIVVRNPLAYSLEWDGHSLNESLASIGHALAQLTRLESELNDGREAYVLRNIGAMRELQHRQNLASANARATPPR